MFKNIIETLISLEASDLALISQTWLHNMTMQPLNTQKSTHFLDPTKSHKKSLHITVCALDFEFWFLRKAIPRTSLQLVCLYYLIILYITTHLFIYFVLFMLFCEERKAYPLTDHSRWRRQKICQSNNLPANGSGKRLKVFWNTVCFLVCWFARHKIRVGWNWSDLNWLEIIWVVFFEILSNF